MTKMEALREAQRINSNVNVAERVTEAIRIGRGTFYYLACAYLTKGGVFSVQTLGVGKNWEDALADLSEKTDAGR
jgi:hypothetical protein